MTEDAGADVVGKRRGDGSIDVRCKHCSLVERFERGVPMAEASVRIRAFAAKHRRCKSSFLEGKRASERIEYAMTKGSR